MRSLFALLERSAQRDPERELIIAKKTLRYGEALARARALGVALAEAGVGRGDRVLMLLPDGPDLVVALYGINAGGAAVVPLSPDARAPSLRRLIERCRARALVTTAKNVKLLLAADGPAPPDTLSLCITSGRPLPDAVVDAAREAHGDATPRVVTIDALIEQGSAAADAAADALRPGEGDLASIMFTSGTTAEPKGVMLTHANLVASTEAIVQYLGLKTSERHALVLPLFYSYGLSVLHTHVMVGATLCVCGSVAFPAAVLRNIEQHRCTGLSGVPSTFARLLHSGAMDKHDLSTLGYLTQAGGPMSPALTRVVLEKLPQARLFVMYGQTEAAPRLTYLEPDELLRKLGTVGKGMPGVELRVIDDDGKDCGPGEQGQLIARGPNVMQGYWEDAAATARALVEGWLHTGDLAVMDEDGFFSIVGRKTDMIKAGAHRVAPQEIERVIETLDTVAQSAVVGVPDELDGEAIAAFIVKRPGAELDEQGVRKRCFEHLPRFKLPTHVTFVDELPRTNSGKLRRAALREGFTPPAPPAGADGDAAAQPTAEG